MAERKRKPKRTLTALGIERMKPPKEGQADYFDAGYPGLALRVSYGGGKAFVYFYRFGGKQRRMTFGRWPGTTLEEAHEEWRAARKALDKGLDPAVERQAQKAEPAAEPDTFERIADDYERRGFPNPRKSRKLAPRTVEEYRRQLARLKAAWQGRMIADIGKGDVLDLLDELVEDGKPVEANRTYALARKLFGWCAMRDIISVSPVAGIHAPSEETPSDRTLTDDEIRLLWPAFGKLGYPFGPWARLLLLTGQRREAVATMRWQDVDLEAKVWRMRQKGDRALLVPLVPAAVEIIESLPRLKGPFVFTTGNTRKRRGTAAADPAPTPISGYSAAKRRVDKLVADAIAERAKETSDKPEPMAHWRWHDLRRTLRTNLSRLKVQRHIAELVIGHAVGGIEAVYDVWEYQDEKRDALERWATFLTGLTSPNVVTFRIAAE
jgi:integrase